MSKTAIHATAASVAMLIIATFWSSTLIAELFLAPSTIVAVKYAIAYAGIPLLVLSMAVTGISGTLLAKGRQGRLVAEKKKRMPLIAANGLLIMIPAAFFLHARAAAGQYDAWFYAVQAVELAVGLLQLTLMSKNLIAGLRLSGKWRAKLNKPQ